MEELTACGEEEEEEVLIKKTGATSVIWTWFGFKKSDVEQKNIICKVCRATIIAKRGNTTNLFHHLKMKHPLEYQDSQKLRPPPQTASQSSGKKKGGPAHQQTDIMKAFSKGTPYDKKNRRWIDITNAITLYLCKDMVPFLTVEKRGFQNMIKTLDPRYEVPSRKYFSQTEMPKLYDKVREQVKNELRSIKYYATTTDLWSSRTMEPYISLTIHFINDEWKLCSRCLQTSYFPEDHTGELISQGLKEALESWGLKEELQVCITTDNGANIVKAVEINGWTRLQCFGHRLHLAIERSVKDARVEHAIGKCKKIVSAFSYAWKRKREMANAQAELNLPPHRLITETPTRWGSRQQMIQRLLEQEKAISQVLKADRKTRHLVPTWQDIDVLESMNKTLSPLLEFTDALSGEEYVSVSTVKPVLHLLNTTVLPLADDDIDTELTKDMKTAILKYLNEKYSDVATDDLLDMASLVDPRFRSSYIADDRREFIFTKAAAEIQALLETQAVSATESSSPSHTSTGAAGEAQREPKRSKRSLGSFLKNASAQPGPAALTDREAIKIELKSYLQALDVEGEADPLEWWRLHQANFPRVASLAKKYLCIPATSAPSERAFSTSGNIVTCHRSALKPETVDKLVFLAKNLG
ncbi:E3 SUMO-protein ligase ZBED1-like [Bufo bufo]|uniref:E3 SUMO-protein ligase ZBED1-like n=1 Tax=Bufo bufo TaxID=8384 RepID=UPI001ABE81BF|nr:E3 SUMO-protein ligase ZBED1-like [Bufo bufo]XP_040278098.1 E3 SUMO-protein ligase ZBED1-like [Bufo bufo]